MSRSDEHQVEGFRSSGNHPRNPLVPKGFVYDYHFDFCQHGLPINNGGDAARPLRNSAVNAFFRLDAGSVQLESCTVHMDDAFYSFQRLIDIFRYLVYTADDVDF